MDKVALTPEIVKSKFEFVFEKVFHPLDLIQSGGNGFFYHYTSISSAMNIVNTGEIWASSYRFMNDTTELESGYKIARECIGSLVAQEGDLLKKDAFEKIRDNLVFDSNEGFDLFISSLTLDPDSLSQWRAYGSNGEGCALGFRSDFEFGDNWAVNRVEYDYLKQVEICRAYFDELASLYKEICKEADHSIREYARKELTLQVEVQFCAIAHLLKSKHFRDEREVRIYEFREDSQNIRFRPGNGLVVPYAAINIGQGKSTAISRVVIGPGRNSSLCAEGMERYLQSIGCRHVEVSVSDIPFRML